MYLIVCFAWMLNQFNYHSLLCNTKLKQLHIRHVFAKELKFVLSLSKLW